MGHTSDGEWPGFRLNSNPVLNLPVQEIPDGPLANGARPATRVRAGLRTASIALGCRGLSALVFLRDLETLLGNHLGQPLSDPPRSKQRDAFRSEPLLGDPHQLFERVIPGLAK